MAVLDDDTNVSFRNWPQMAVARPGAWSSLCLSNASQSAGVVTVSLPDHRVFHSSVNATFGLDTCAPKMSKSTRACPRSFTCGHVPPQAAELVSVTAIARRSRSAAGAYAAIARCAVCTAAMRSTVLFWYEL